MTQSFKVKALDTDGVTVITPTITIPSVGESQVVIGKVGDVPVQVAIVEGGSSGGGDASAANQATEIARLTSILAEMSTGSKQDTIISGIATILADLAGTLVVSAASLPLPSGAANQTKQDSIITALGLLGTAAQQTAAKTVFDQISTNTAAATPTGENHIGEVAGNTATVTGTFTRPADTNVYASADLVANSTTAGSVVPVTLAVSRANDKPFTIPRLRLKKSSNILTNASFRVHLYRNSPTIANGDNGAWSTTESEYLGAFDITMDKAFTDLAKGIGVPSVGSAIISVPASGTVNIFALIEARAAYTPISGEVFTITAEVLRD